MSCQSIISCFDRPRPSIIFSRIDAGSAPSIKARTSARKAFSSAVKRRSMTRSCAYCVLRLMYLEQAGSAHAAADAHGDDGVFGAAAAAFDQHVAGHARAAHAVGMADRDGAAVDVEPFLRNAEAVAAIEHLARERFVELPQVDVADLEALASEQLGHGEHRPDAHLVGLAAGDGEAAERTQRLEPA